MRKIRLSKRKAKRDAVAVWQWLADNPGKCKSDLPKHVYESIKDDESRCPLCTLFARSKKNRCAKCPLVLAGIGCSNEGSPYIVWSITTKYLCATREAAQQILAAIRAWKV